MITVELHRVPEGAHEYVPVATLHVSADRTFELVDPEALFPLDLGVLVSDEPTGLRRVTLEEDPVVFARNLGSVLRTGYLVPVIVEDTELVVQNGAAAETP